MKELDKLRSQIDWLDRDIMAHLESRMDLVAKVKAIKKEENIATLDVKREEEIKHYIEVNCKYVEEIKTIYDTIMTQSKKLQDE